MVKKCLSMIFLFTAFLAFCAVKPAGRENTVFAAADYGSSTLELYARRVASQINSRRAGGGVGAVIFCGRL